MARWRPLEPCDATFFADAPHVYRYDIELPVSAERAWESLTSQHSVADWTPLLRSIEWTSELGLGATRTVMLPLHALTFHEHFFIWDEGTRMAFYALEANRPMLRRFAEDYQVEPHGTGSRFTWTFALEGNRFSAATLKATDKANALLFRRIAQSAKGYFARTS
jgi:Polyketide cyclase / dehydrase and lipid transport